MLSVRMCGLTQYDMSQSSVKPSSRNQSPTVVSVAMYIVNILSWACGILYLSTSPPRSETVDAVTYCTGLRRLKSFNFRLSGRNRLL